MAYRVYRLSLAAVEERKQVHPANSPISTVHVLSLSPGVFPTLALGNGADAIPVFPGYVARLCPGGLDGLWLANPIPAPGAELVVQVWSNGGGSEGPR